MANPLRSEPGWYPGTSKDPGGLVHRWARDAQLRLVAVAPQGTLWSSVRPHVRSVDRPEREDPTELSRISNCGAASWDQHGVRVHRNVLTLAVDRPRDGLWYGLSFEGPGFAIRSRTPAPGRSHPRSRRTAVP
jgi:hypothetical protein